MVSRKLAGILGSCIVSIIGVGAIAALNAEPVTDYATLLSYLRDSGASIREEGATQEPFFNIEGRRVTVNESTIEVYEYASVEAMEIEASCVSPEGCSFREAKEDIARVCFVDWAATPHFYRAGRVIVFYCGDNDSILSLLENALGKQFAGQRRYFEDVMSNL
jgi:hypothetical protein